MKSFSLVSFSKRLFSVMSVAYLLREGFSYGWVDPVDRMLDFYGAVIGFVFGWLDPFVRESVTFLRSVLSIDIQLRQDWKIYFIPMWIYLSGDVFVTVSRGYRAGAAILALWSVSLSLIGAVSIAFKAADSPMLPAILIPAILFVLYELGQTIIDSCLNRRPGQSFGHVFRLFFFRNVLSNFIFGIACLAIAHSMYGAGFLRSAGIVALFILILLMTVRNVAVGVYYAEIKPFKDGWKDSLLKSATARLGVEVSIVVWYIMIACIANAGAQMMLSRGA